MPHTMIDDRNVDKYFLHLINQASRRQASRSSCTSPETRIHSSNTSLLHSSIHHRINTESSKVFNEQQSNNVN